jgi:hypothetical protein
MLGSSIDLLILVSEIGEVKPEEINIPIPFKLAAVHDAYDKNFVWILPENLFYEGSKPKSTEKGTSKSTIDSIECLIERIHSLDLNAPPLDNT